MISTPSTLTTGLGHGRLELGSMVANTYRMVTEPSIWRSIRLIAQLVKNLPAMQETPVRFLGREDPLEKG